MLPGQVRQRGCLCHVSPDLPLQGGHTNPAETPAVGTVPSKLEDRGKVFGCDELVPELLLRSFLFLSLWALAVPSVLQSLVLGKDTYNCLRDKSSSVPPNSLPRSMLFR